jgi:hypothetical protein
MLQFLNPATWSKKFSLAFAVVASLFTMAVTPPLNTGHAAVQCVVALSACLIAMRYLRVQGGLDEKK